MTPTSSSRSVASFSDENDYITAEDYGLELMKLSLTSSNVQHICKGVENFQDLVQELGTEADKENFRNLIFDCKLKVVVMLKSPNKKTGLLGHPLPLGHSQNIGRNICGVLWKQLGAWRVAIRAFICTMEIVFIDPKSLYLNRVAE
ncbi:hypothetical protein BT96DRAFT_971627 [Gymnopus androsaceus JB14]|uniref:Uncharacterized protein n=1 Tax=Gymnopus androsaceus JB14 TaxID=1447944 RepID=A0A6A4ICN1_9AGAR|nr:hypothetical protein BT96DRAFT_971627 [Gymnopus androsaceus JB14]